MKQIVRSSRTSNSNEAPTISAKDSRQVHRLVQKAMRETPNHWARVEDFRELAVQLLQREGYYATSVCDFGCDLVALCPDHVLLGYVSLRDWPTEDELDVLRWIPAPSGTRRVVFCWHSLKGFPDRRTLD